MIEAALRTLAAGGWVAYVLVLVSVAMWSCVVLRGWILLDVGTRAPWLTHRAAVAHALQRCEAFRTVLDSLVSAAPLLGLLGTVHGMVDTFASLRPTGGVALTHATEQTVAGGISVALITTQLGLVIGVAGLLAARMLDRLEARRRTEILAHADGSLEERAP